MSCSRTDSRSPPPSRQSWTNRSACNETSTQPAWLRSCTMSFNPDLSCPWSLRASPLSHLQGEFHASKLCLFILGAYSCRSALRRLRRHRAHLVPGGVGEPRRVGDHVVDLVEGFDDFVRVLGRSRAHAVGAPPRHKVVKCLHRVGRKLHSGRTSGLVCPFSSNSRVIPAEDRQKSSCCASDSARPLPALPRAQAIHTRSQAHDALLGRKAEAARQGALTKAPHSARHAPRLAV